MYITDASDAPLGHASCRVQVVLNGHIQFEFVVIISAIGFSFQFQSVLKLGLSFKIQLDFF